MKSKKELKRAWESIGGVTSDINIRQKLRLQFEILLDIRELLKRFQKTGEIK